MRVFELSTRVKGVSRSNGRSATAAAAYRACCTIECERTGRIHDYSRKHGLELSEIVLPEGAPAWARERAKLWNAAELRERNGARGKNAGADKAHAKTAREYFFTFPVELSAAGRAAAARAIARHLTETHGIAADIAIHRPGKTGDSRNYHCHILATTRRLTPKGLGPKAREWDDLKTGPKLAKELRTFIAATLNAGLKEEGKAELVRVEHRSFEERGKPQAATRHQGPAKTHTLRKKRGRAREAWHKAAKNDQRARHAKELASLKLRQAFALQKKLGELAERGRVQAAAIRREVAKQRQADAAPDGLRRAFTAITGRAGREAFDRQARDASRVISTRERLAELRAALRAEWGAFAEAKARERAILIERHTREGERLQQVARGHVHADQLAEVQQRRTEARAQDRQIERSGRGISLGPS